MEKEYKIHFLNRKIVLTNNLKDNFINNFGYFVDFKPANEFANLLQFFEKVTSITTLYIFGDNIEKMFSKLKEHFTLIEAAGGLIHNGKEEYLIIKRHGIWDLPKGKEEKGEKPEQAALREVSEECGISKIELEGLLTHTYHTYELENKKVLKRTSWFKMKYRGNGEFTPQVSEDITEVRWVHKNDLPNYLGNTYQSIIEVFKAEGLS